MNEVKITYETLFDLLRREKDREELQKLDDTFYSDVMEYLKQKHSFVKDEGVQTGLFAATESEKTKVQIQNIKKIIKELYERRQAKIIRLAVNKSRVGTGISNTVAMLPEEKTYFEEMVKIFTKNREEVLNKLLMFGNGDVKAFEKPEEKKEAEAAPKTETAEAPEEPETAPEDDNEAMEDDDSAEGEKAEDEEIGLQSENEAEAAPEQLKTEAKPEASAEIEEAVAKPDDNYKIKVKVKFTGPVPKFVGKQMELYGPYKEGDEAELPKMIANILINKSRAEIIEKIET